DLRTVTIITFAPLAHERKWHDESVFLWPTGYCCQKSRRPHPRLCRGEEPRRSNPQHSNQVEIYASHRRTPPPHSVFSTRLTGEGLSVGGYLEYDPGCSTRL